MPQLKQAKEVGNMALFRHTKLISREKNETGVAAVTMRRDGGEVEVTTRQKKSLPASVGVRQGAVAATRSEDGGGAAAVVDGSGDAAGGAVAPGSVAGVAMSPASGVPSPGRRYAAVASTGVRGLGGAGEGATQGQAKYLRSRRK